MQKSALEICYYSYDHKINITVEDQQEQKLVDYQREIDQMLISKMANQVKKRLKTAKTNRSIYVKR